MTQSAQFDGVSVVKQANVYFDGKCVSHTVLFADGCKKTVGVILWTYSTDPENAITINGKWAYSTAAPADFVHATIRWAAYLYRAKDAQVFDITASPELGILTIPKGIPEDVRILLGPYRKIV